jgi:hypothetical protein
MYDIKKERFPMINWATMGSLRDCYLRAKQ